MQIRWAMVLMAGGLFLGVPAQPESEFVMPAKRGGPSAAVLKEEIVDQLALILKQVPDILRAVATVQEQSLKALEQYAEGQKKCFWDTASKEQLAAVAHRVRRQ